MDAFLQKVIDYPKDVQKAIQTAHTVNIRFQNASPDTVFVKCQSKSMGEDKFFKVPPGQDEYWVREWHQEFDFCVFSEESEDASKRVARKQVKVSDKGTWLTFDGKNLK
ncbi:hypothetical protein FVE85_0589 [Porphyridium purpureum]|uniref:Uncharacterized protein n=1 Tax=Porphyridium purpureum TaxID=35688 RepID=A0A5J4Z0S2_PORPP|nr:hypothetical protein FVE85_0589 [Porphyridium purpureum]|eukprot:POR8715..scf208_2